MTSERISTSSSTPGRPPKKASTISSKLNSQNGSRRLRGVSTCALSPKQRPYSLCGSTRKMRRFGRVSRIFCRMMATPLDLPTPVAPTMAKCRLTRLIDVDVHADVGVLLQVADMRMVGVGRAVDEPQFALGQQHARHRRCSGYSVMPRWKRAAPSVAGADFAEQIEPRDLAEAASAGRRQRRPARRSR